MAQVYSTGTIQMDKLILITDYFFLLSLVGPSSLIFKPMGDQDCNLFLHSSSNVASSASVPSKPTDCRRVNFRKDLSVSVVLRLWSPTIWSLCALLQWMAMLQLLYSFLMWDLWLAHLCLGFSVFPTYWRPQGQLTTYTTLTALQEMGAAIEKPLSGILLE